MTSNNEVSSQASDNSLATPVKKKRFCWHAVTGLVALLALSLAIYAIYQNRQITSQKNHIDRMSQQQQEISSQLMAMQQSLQQTQTTVATRMDALHQQMHTALKQRLYQQQDWSLLKARYYLELAQINAHWSDDAQTTVALLEEADQLLQTLSDQRLYPVRQAIAKEIAQVKAIPPIDVAGILSQLDAAQTLALQLPTRHNLPTPADKVNDPKASDSMWQQRMQQSLGLLEKLVIIRHHAQQTQGMLSPLHQSLVRENLSMDFQEAQWAVLQKNAKVYQQSLVHALQQIKRNFDNKAIATQTLVKQLEDLQKTLLEAPQPELQQALPLLNQIIESGSPTPAKKTGNTQENNK